MLYTLKEQKKGQEIQIHSAMIFVTILALQQVDGML